MAKQKLPLNPTLGRNLRWLMDGRVDLSSQPKVAAKTDISQSSVGRILRGEVNPSSHALQRLAQAFQIDVGDFYLPHEEFAAKHMSELQRGMKVIEPFVRAAEKMAAGLIPVYSLEQLAEYERSTNSWVPCPISYQRSIFAVDVEGVDMFDPAGPLSFREGDRLFATDIGQAHHRDLVLVRRQGESKAMFRQLILDGDRQMLLQLNPSWPNRVTAVTDDDTMVGIVLAKLEVYARE